MRPSKTRSQSSSTPDNVQGRSDGLTSRDELPPECQASQPMCKPCTVRTWCGWRVPVQRIIICKTEPTMLL